MASRLIGAVRSQQILNSLLRIEQVVSLSIIIIIIHVWVDWRIYPLSTLLILVIYFGFPDMCLEMCLLLCEKVTFGEKVRDRKIERKEMVSFD